MRKDKTMEKYDRETLIQAAIYLRDSREALFRSKILLEKMSPHFDRTTKEIGKTRQDLGFAVHSIDDFIIEQDFQQNQRRKRE